LGLTANAPTALFGDHYHDLRHQGGNCVPRIRITTESRTAGEAAVLLDERVSVSDLTSAHFTSQLLERIGWAVADADDTERNCVG
jgi:hypothetical protein